MFNLYETATQRNLCTMYAAIGISAGNKAMVLLENQEILIVERYSYGKYNVYLIGDHQLPLESFQITEEEIPTKIDALAQSTNKIWSPLGVLPEINLNLDIQAITQSFSDFARSVFTLASELRTIKAGIAQYMVLPEDLPEKPKETAPRIPTTQHLAHALRLANAPASMVQKAEQGHYDDYKSPLAGPIAQLIVDCQNVGTRKMLQIATMAQDGEFDGQKWEAEEWAQSAEGQETLKQILTS